jgi:hypothetical protein
MQHVTGLIQSMVKAGLDREKLRLSVIAHVAIEMMIDRQIVLEKRDLCEDYYRYLNQADEKVIHTFFDSFLPAEMKPVFFSRFRFVKERKFLFLFDELENIVFGLERIYSSVTKVEFTPEEKSRFLLALSNIDADIRYSWQEILKA